MKQSLIKFFFGFPVVLLFIGCRKEKISDQLNQQYSTRIYVYVRDELSNSVSGASVTYYSMGWPQITKLSDSEGKVLFEEVDPYLPSIIAWKGCKSNINGVTTLYVTQNSGNSFNTFDCLIQDTGVLGLEISTASTISVASSVYTGQLSGIDTFYFKPNAGTLNFSSRLQGSSVWKDTILQITCGDTTELILP